MAKVSAQRGTIGIMFAGAILLIFALLGYTYDLSRVYNRKAELQQLVNAAALAAAHELNGTQTGVNNAVTKATVSVERLTYDFHQPASWSESAITFSDSLDGDWVSASSAKGNPKGIKYARVQTSGLDSAMEEVRTLFMGILSAANASVRVGATAIAGPSQIAVVPFGICALSTTPAAARLNPGSSTPTFAAPNTELVEYGFRRGVGYDLMNLNPNGLTPANFIVSPISGVLDQATVGAFICTGSLVARGIVDKSVSVSSPFPMSTLYNHFNSRFDQYPAGACSPNSAPPDANVKAYDRSVAGAVPWMTPVPATQPAQPTNSGGKAWTVADPLPALGTNTSTSYGVLWAYSKAIPYSSYVAGSAEPSGGYTPFATTEWKTLYDPGRPAATASYPTSATTPTPYSQASGTNFLAPSTAHRPCIRNRRVLNVPLLSCPVSGSTATVLAIGKFFMTVPATSTALVGEFAGIASEDGAHTQVELFQ
jgi:hypothetical protein